MNCRSFFVWHKFESLKLNCKFILICSCQVSQILFILLSLRTSSAGHEGVDSDEEEEFIYKCEQAPSSSVCFSDDDTSVMI